MGFKKMIFTDYKNENGVLYECIFEFTPIERRETGNLGEYISLQNGNIIGKVLSAGIDVMTASFPAYARSKQIIGTVLIGTAKLIKTTLMTK